MPYRIYFKSTDPALGYVSGSNPLTYTAVKGDAMIIPIDLNNLDADYIEEKIWKPLCQMIDQANTMDWNMVLETDTEELVAQLVISNETIACASTASLDMYSERALRELCSILADYLMSKALERVCNSATTNLSAVSGTGASSGSSQTSAQATEETDIDELVKAVEAKSKVSISKPKETLADYVCDTSLKEELEEIKDFFENRATYSQAGIRLPKGILFKGVPGTGKTYAARCIAGSVDCFFMSCTASSMQGMYIGSGAENIRNVFLGAKKLYEASKKGVIIFIDEIDSFGSRESHSGSSSGEEDRTLNQLLAEMSGFEDADGIMVLAATNYPERIDDALMRSGRFSRQITISIPDEVERLNLVKYYFNKLSLKIDPNECDEAIVAALTEGMTPADIAEISNEAGILTIRHKDSEIRLDYINEAINKVITKNIRKPDKSPEFHELVAVHEAGHVLAEYLYKNKFSVKVTNYSYGDAGGFTQPQKSKEGIITLEAYKNDVMCLLGGRAAEQVMLKEVSTGASEDFARAVRAIRAYYKDYHFEPYEVDKLEQIVNDTLHKWYSECVDKFTNAYVALSALACELTAERILYTSDIANLLTKYTI